MEIKEKSVHLILGGHDKRGIGNIDLLGQIVTSALIQHNAPVGVFIESANTDSVKAGLIRALTMQGTKPKDAYAIIGYALKTGLLQPNINSIDFKLFKQDYLKSFKPFARRELDVLEDIANQHPGKIYIFRENAMIGSEYDRLISIGKESLKDQVDSTTALHKNNDIQTGIRLFKSSLIKFAKVVKDRESRIIEDITGEINETGISCLVGHLGSTHTHVSHALTRSGLDVVRYFPQKEDRTYYYSPFGLGLRQHLFHPDRKMPDACYLSIIIANDIYNLLLHPKSENALSQQWVARNLISIMEDIQTDRELYDQFAENVKSLGYNNALDWLADQWSDSKSAS